MSKTVFTNHTPEVLAKIIAQSDLMMGLMAAGIETQIKMSGTVPFKHGGLRSSVRHIKRGVGSYEVVADKNYAAAQEAGITRGHVMHNYTTAGTGPHWFRKSIDVIKLRKLEYARTASNAVGMRENI